MGRYSTVAPGGRRNSAFLDGTLRSRWPVWSACAALALAAGCSAASSEALTPDASTDVLASLNTARSEDAADAPEAADAADASSLDADADRCACNTFRPRETCTASQQGCVCTNSEYRGTCSGGFWYSEPAACPVTQPAPGSACTAPGLHCGAGFEALGYECVAPENQWTFCKVYGPSQGPTGGARSSCPDVAPALGTPCCAVFTGRPTTCAYDGGTMSCSGSHWTAD